jgi:uncharacterized protein
MLQLICLVLASWALLHYFSHQSLQALGIRLTGKQVIVCLAFFMLSAFFSSLPYIGRAWFAQEQFAYNTTLSVQQIATDLWYQFRTVCTEELLFRGALFYLLLQRLGAKSAMWISAVLFAIMHVLQPQIWGQPITALMLFVYTLCMGLLLCYSFIKTQTIWVPLAIHLGWNVVQNYFFSDQTPAHSLFVSIEQPQVTIGYLLFFLIFIAPKLLILGVHTLILQSYPGVTKR